MGSARLKLVSEIREIRSLTGLRGVAALYVLGYHYAAVSNPRAQRPMLLAHGYLAVDLFFVLSGFVMTLNYARLFESGFTIRAGRDFLTRRLARVYPLYLASTVLSLALVHFEGGQLLHLKKAIAENLAMVQTWGLGESFVPTGWSISAEWAAYLVFPFALRLCLRGSRLGRSLAATSCVFLLGVLVAVHQRSAPLGNRFALLDLYASRDALPVLRCLPEFCLGILAADLYQLRTRAPFWMRRGVGDVVPVVLLLLLTLPWTDLVIVACTPLLILTLTQPDGFWSRLLAHRVPHRLGVLSYSIYLLHIALLESRHQVSLWAAKLGLPGAGRVGFGVTFCLTLLAAEVAYRCIEKPGRTAIRRLTGAGGRRSSALTSTAVPS